MRFGNGTQLSLNSSGNFLQPFYFINPPGTWRNLTYASLPLFSKLGVEGDGSGEWNFNGSLASNPVMSNQVFDSSNFTINSGIGSGVLKVKGDITVGSVQLELINSYSLGLDQKFIEVTTTIKNISSSSVSNVRYWIGTSHDFIGNVDNLTKTRGNLVNGVFEELTAINQRSTALKINSGDEAVLFFTTSTSGNTSHAEFSFGNDNPSTINYPDTAAITVTNDGSYSLFVRLNDLAVGQSDSFVWYYAAATLAELDETFLEVSEAVDEIDSQDMDLDGIFDQDDACPNTAGVSALNGCPWPIYIGNNYKSTTVSNTIDITNEEYLCSLTASGYYNLAYHSGSSPEPSIGDYLIFNNKYAFPNVYVFGSDGFAFMKLKDYNKIVEVQKTNGRIVAIYTCQ